MRVLIIQNCETEGIGFYKEYLIKRQISYDIFHAYLNQKFPLQTEYDFFIIAGTPISVREINQYSYLYREREYFKRVIDANKFCLGICFGGQLLANILGAKVRKNPVREIGVYEARLTFHGKKDLCLAGFPYRFSVFQWHGDTFDLPQRAVLLASGKYCLNQAFRLKNIVGLQFHLEIGSTEAGNWADKYTHELNLERKTKKGIVREGYFCTHKDGADV